MHRRLDIVVPIYRNATLTRKCIQSLLENIREVASLDPRLILINDSPGDRDVDFLLEEMEAAGPNMIILRNEENLGFVRTVNRGLILAVADGHDVVLVNSDTQTFPGTLAELWKAANADPQIGFASPRSNNASICSLPHFPGDSSMTPDAAFQRWGEISRTMPDFHFAPTAVGFYMFISHQVLANHGGLREEFGMGYEEENDLVMRAGKLGTRAVIVNRAFAYHTGSASFDLVDIDLSNHRHRNLLRISDEHPEFLPLVKRYEAAPHFRAERLMAGLLKDADDRTKVAIDLSSLGPHHDGTAEQTVAVIKAMAARHAHSLSLTGIASAEVFRYHGLDGVQYLQRESAHAPGLHGIAIRMSQPFDLDHLTALESMAPINVFAMLDTIAEDCGPLAANGGFLELWDHCAEHANGLIFISEFSERTFCNRHPRALARARWQCLLPTSLSSYAGAHGRSWRNRPQSYLLVLGNQFAHKHSDATARFLAEVLPSQRIVVLGTEEGESLNIRSFRAGTIAPADMERLYGEASVIVLPSYVEGFGLGFMHALAAGRPIVARRIPATLEILARLQDVEGVFLFDDNEALREAVERALRVSKSSVNDERGGSWDDWADGLTQFCLSLTNNPDVFDCLVRRLAAGDRLRRAGVGDSLAAQAAQPNKVEAAVRGPIGKAKPVDLETLLALEGRDFVEHAYATLLRRPADSAGLKAYMEQLELGVDKLDILSDFASSPEGRARDVQLPGLKESIVRRRRSRLPWIKRVFTSSKSPEP